MPIFGRKVHPLPGLIVLSILLIFVYCHAISDDKRSMLHLNDMEITDSNDSTITKAERIKVEKIIKRYEAKNSTNKSLRKKIMRDVFLGSLRGAIGGAALGGEIGIIPGMVSMGTVNGVISWCTSMLKTNDFINKNHYTAK